MRKSVLLKLLMLAICAAMVLSLFACEGGEVETEAPEQTEASDPADTDPEDDPADTDPEDDTTVTDPEGDTDPEPTCDGNHELKAKGDTGHYYTVSCDICGIVKETVAPHTYETVDGKPTCTACKYVASCNGVHNYESNAEEHWISDCIACGAEGVDADEHTPVYADNKYACTVCGFVYTCPTDGVHALVSDGANGHHTVACPICNAAEGEVVAHTFTDKDGSRFCECGYEAECKGVHEVTSTATGHAFAACDICGADATDEVPHDTTLAEIEAEGAYKYGCGTCGYVFYTKALTDKVAAFITPGNINTQKPDATKTDLTASTHFRIKTAMNQMAEGMPYVTIDNVSSETTVQLLWNRAAAKTSNSVYEEYTFDVGNSKFLVLKARANTNADIKLHIYLSTVGAEKLAYKIIPLAASETEAEWVTYVIDLEKLYSESYIKAEGADSYVIDTFYFHIQSFGVETDTLDIAYMAFVEGDWADVGALVDEETVTAVIGSDLGNEVNADTGICVGEHVITTTIVDGEYKSACACGYVKTTYGIKEIGPNKIWGAETIATTGSKTGSVDKTLIYDDDGTAFVRLNNFWPNRDNWGDFSIAISSGVGTAATTGRYLVIKYRVGAAGNGTNIIQVFANTNKGGSNNLVAAAEASFAKTNDNEWHTIVIDLAERVKDPSKAFVDEGDGTYNVRYLSIRPFGGASIVTSDDADGRYFYTYWVKGAAANGKDLYKEQVNGKENRLTAEEMKAKGYDVEKIHKCNVASDDMYVDFSYVALFDSIEDIPNIVTTDTYEWNVDNSTNAERNTADNTCVTHAISEKVEGTTHTIACTSCGYVVKTYEISASINYYADLTIMNCFQTTLTKNLYDEEANLFYNKFYSSTGGHFNLTGGNGAGTWTAAAYGSGKYVVVKYRSTSNQNMYVGTKDRGTIEGQTNPLRASVGTLYASADWKVQIFEIPNDCASYTVNSEQNLYFMVGSAAGTFEVAYLAVVDEVAEAITLLGEGETFYLGSQHLDKNMQLIPCDGGCTYVSSSSSFVCSGCGATINGTLYRNEGALGNYTNYSVHNNVGAAGKATTGQTDSATGYTYSRMQANPESSSATIQGRNFLGGSAASSINYLIFRYRVGENGLGQENIALYFNTADEAHSLRINVEEDNTWHTVIVDLKACVGDGTVYDGSYTNAFFRPFGDLEGDTVRSNADAYVDFAYTIGCGTLEDAVKILGTDTYEWLNGSTVEVRDSATHQVVTAE